MISHLPGILGSHKTSHRWCKFDSGLLELEPHPKWNLPLGWPGGTFSNVSFSLPFLLALESRIGVEQSYVSKMMATNCHHHHLVGLGKSHVNFSAFKTNKTKLYLKESILLGICCKKLVLTVKTFFLTNLNISPCKLISFHFSLSLQVCLLRFPASKH